MTGRYPNDDTMPWWAEDGGICDCCGEPASELYDVEGESLCAACDERPYAVRQLAAAQDGSMAAADAAEWRSE